MAKVRSLSHFLHHWFLQWRLHWPMPVLNEAHVQLACYRCCISCPSLSLQRENEGFGEALSWTGAHALVRDRWSPFPITQQPGEVSPLLSVSSVVVQCSDFRHLWQANTACCQPQVSILIWCLVQSQAPSVPVNEIYRWGNNRTVPCPLLGGQDILLWSSACACGACPSPSPSRCQQ